MRDIFQNELEVLETAFIERVDKFLLQRNTDELLLQHRSAAPTGPLTASIKRNISHEPPVSAVRPAMSVSETLPHDSFKVVDLEDAGVHSMELQSQKSPGSDPLRRYSAVSGRVSISSRISNNLLHCENEKQPLGWMNRHRKSYKPAPRKQELQQRLASAPSPVFESPRNEFESPRSLRESPRSWSTWVNRHRESYSKLHAAQKRVQQMHTGFLGERDRTLSLTDKTASARELVVDRSGSPAAVEMKPLLSGHGYDMVDAGSMKAGGSQVSASTEDANSMRMKPFASASRSSTGSEAASEPEEHKRRNGKRTFTRTQSWGRNRITGGWQARSSADAAESHSHARRLSVDLFGREPFQEAQEEDHSCLFNILQSTEFAYFSASLVVLNSIAIGWQTDYRARLWSDETPVIFRISDQVFCIIFGIELTLRLVAFGCSFFWMHGWEWNLFDFLVVGTQCIEELIHICVPMSRQRSERVSILRIMRIFRLIRILRLARLLHLLGELRMILASIAASLQSLFWTVFFLLLLMYIIGVYLTQVVTDFKVNHREVVGDFNQPQYVLEQYYGSLDKSMICLYATISEGIHWYEIMSPLTMYISPWLQLVFCFYSGFVIFAVLNIVTGVFVESAIETANGEKRKVMLYQMQQLFKSADADCSGTIDWDEFEVQLSNPQMLDYLQQVDIDPNEARDLFYLLDIEETGEIEIDSLVDGCMRLHGYAKSIDLAAFMHEYKRAAAVMESHLYSIKDCLDELLKPHQADRDEGSNTPLSSSHDLFRSPPD